jgi:hypothetical protein
MVENASGANRYHGHERNHPRDRRRYDTVTREIAATAAGIQPRLNNRGPSMRVLSCKQNPV